MKASRFYLNLPQNIQFSCPISENNLIFCHKTPYIALLQLVARRTFFYVYVSTFQLLSTRKEKTMFISYLNKALTNLPIICLSMLLGGLTSVVSFSVL